MKIFDTKMVVLYFFYCKLGIINNHMDNGYFIIQICTSYCARWEKGRLISLGKEPIVWRQKILKKKILFL